MNNQKEIKISDLKIMTHENKAYRHRELLQLTKIEYDLLLFFSRNKGVILLRERIIDSVWRMDYDGDPRTVDTHIRRLRTKIGNEYIKTYRGVGYCLEVKVH